MKVDSFEHRFVEKVPLELEPGVLYVSTRYRTALHLCACGCGNKVVTPIKPPRWHFTFDGDSISIDPSVGSWQFPCRSHYWIKKNRVKWSLPWTDEQIALGRARDLEDMRLYYESEEAEAVVAEPEQRSRRTWRERVAGLFRR